jgi:hypothetical protein
MNKIYLLLITVTLLVFSCGNEEITDRGNTSIIGMDNPPIISFQEVEYDFGTIVEGREINKRFNFTNSGKGPLVISAVNGSCGCTVPKNWPKEPVQPGDSAYIEVFFNSEGRIGVADKYVTISANTQPADTRVRIKGTVVGPTN